MGLQATAATSLTGKRWRIRFTMWATPLPRSRLTGPVISTSLKTRVALLIVALWQSSFSMRSVILAYILPDVVCDFTQIKLEQVADNRVRVSGARGRGVPSTYKTSMTWADGWRAGTTFWCIGRRAADKARILRKKH